MSLDDRRKWDARYRKQLAATPSPESPFLVSVAHHLPAAGRCLDVAGGAGRNALWLAARGLNVTVSDISEVALEIAAARASATGVSLHGVATDLREQPLPAGPWDVIVSTLYLQRDLFPAFAAALAPGGVLLFMQPTLTNLQRHDKPSARFLLAPGELATLLPNTLTVLSLTEAWTPEGQHQARLVARKRRG